MLKKMGMSSLWQWPSCKQNKTEEDKNMFKTINSIFFDPLEPDSWFKAEEEFGGESLEMIVKGVMRSETERLFFEPGESKSIMEEAKIDGFPFKESVLLAMESDDPSVDFRRSMEEMVESNGVHDWQGLEELLSWYLKVNGKKNHCFIIGAFVDLLVGIASDSSFSSSSSSLLSSF